MADSLSDTEMARWQAWKRATDAVWDRVVREIGAAGGLSAADFSVLTRVVETAEPLRQQQLADALGWQRSRLSRQLSRMVDRGLVARVTRRETAVVCATAQGRRALRPAREAHARAVRAALIDQVGDDRRSQFWKVIDTLGAGTR